MIYREAACKSEEDSMVLACKTSEFGVEGMIKLDAT